MKILLNAKQIGSILKKLATRIIADTPDNIEIAVIGIRSRGEIVAQRLASLLSEKMDERYPVVCST